MNRTTVHLTIRGFVQGVGYRYFCYREATRLAITGWVRNRPDGSVEAEVQGDAPAVAGFIEQLRIGPGNARVESVEETPRDTGQHFNQFEIRH